MNKTIIAGRLGVDPKAGDKEGKKYASFSVAVRERRGDTKWFSCVAFGKSAEFAANHLKKGAIVILEGNYSPEIYESNGKQGLRHTLFVDVINAMTFGKEGQSQESSDSW